MSKTKSETTNTPAVVDPNLTEITLETPLVRGEQTIATLTLRKPKSGGLRGLSLASLLQMETQSIIKVVPRISTPTLTEQEMAALDPVDMFQLGKAVTDFLLPKALREEVSPTT